MLHVKDFDPARFMMILGTLLCVKCELTGGTPKCSLFWTRVVNDVMFHYSSLLTLLDLLRVKSKKWKKWKLTIKDLLWWSLPRGKLLQFLDAIKGFLKLIPMIDVG